MSTVHEGAKAGFGEGNAAYDTYRPTYPVEQLDYIQSALPNPSGPLNVLEWVQLASGITLLYSGDCSFIDLEPVQASSRDVCWLIRLWGLLSSAYEPPIRVPA